MKIKAGGKTYEIEGELTLGEFRLLKRHFDVPRMDALDPADPDHLVGFLYVAARRQNPALTVEAFEAEIERVTTIEIDDVADPTTEGSSESSSEPEQRESADAPAAA